MKYNNGRIYCAFVLPFLQSVRYVGRCSLSVAVLALQCVEKNSQCSVPCSVLWDANAHQAHHSIRLQQNVSPNVPLVHAKVIFCVPFSDR